MSKEKVLIGRCTKCESFVSSDDFRDKETMEVFAKKGLCQDCQDGIIKFGIDWFIHKFEEIPEEKWTEGAYQKGGALCALGFCGELSSKEPTIESISLEKLFEEYQLRVSLVNDGECPLYQQDTPKKRIVSALLDIRQKELDKYANQASEGETKVKTM